MGMNYGEALQLLKQGERMYRDSWMAIKFIFLVDGSTFKVNRPPLLGFFKEGTEIKYLPHIDAMYINGEVGVHTLMQRDIMADDWLIHNP
jgi:hypothetical protein